MKIQTILGRSARSRDAYWCEPDHLSRFQRKKKDSFCERGAFVIGRLLLALQVLGILGSPQRKHNLKNRYIKYLNEHSFFILQFTTDTLKYVSLLHITVRSFAACQLLQAQFQSTVALLYCTVPLQSSRAVVMSFM